MRRLLILAALITIGCHSVLQAGVLPPEKSPYTVSLAAVPDPDLVGKKVDLVSRIVTNNSAVAPLEKTVLHDVLLLSIHDNAWAVTDRKAILALSPDEVKKLDKVSDQVGVDLLIHPR